MLWPSHYIRSFFFFFRSTISHHRAAMKALKQWMHKFLYDLTGIAKMKPAKNMLDL